MRLIKNKSLENVFVYILYLATVFMLALSGFGQMPIFKRYYIADIPGMGWLAQFFVTHHIHYLSAILLVGLISYILVSYLFAGYKKFRISISGYIRGVLLLGVTLTGIFLMIRNLAGSGFSPEFIIFLDIGHLGLMMTLLMVSFCCAIFRLSWLKNS